ncbi:sigma-70 family RNA polymerase sigma factor [Anatilimnocola floriformis]|uniref:sigma-70 family RNA polymerase sigma factor n=1 Tax=Anatilimnocola floriformis TaxID=2948575 RepID=UPI0020C36AF0|nr:sigma-70 family RNA polymerase sigma factor [Anatilimnocola floriformis]
MVVDLSAPQNADDSVTNLLAKAREGGGDSLGNLLQLYRNYLTVLATTQISPMLRRRMAPSDLVQETMLAAQANFVQFQGGSERELLGWLRQILINSLHDALEMHLQAKKRDMRREISIEQVSAALDQSVMNFANVLAAPGPSPSAQIRQRERSVLLANQLAKLKPDYRDVIVLRNLQGLPFEEVAERMNRKPSAVRMLWLRAIDHFKQVFEPWE